MKKKTYSIKLDDQMLSELRDHSQKMGREAQDVIREALGIGLQFLKIPEYYAARLNGIKLESIVQAVRAALKKG